MVPGPSPSQPVSITWENVPTAKLKEGSRAVNSWTTGVSGQDDASLDSRGKLCIEIMQECRRHSCLSAREKPVPREAAWGWQGITRTPTEMIVLFGSHHKAPHLTAHVSLLASHQRGQARPLNYVTLHRRTGRGQSGLAGKYWCGLVNPSNSMCSFIFLSH